MNWKIFRRLFLLLVLVFLYLPIVLLAVYSFTVSTNIGAIRGFSLHNYVTLFTTPELTSMIAGTITLALGSAVIATILGTMGAIGAFYSKKNVSAFITTLNQVPVINADVVTGFSICVLLVVALGISKDSYIPLLAGHVTLCAPFVFLSVMPRIKQMDSSIYEAALDLGATPVKALFEILIPQIIPGASGEVQLLGFGLVLVLVVILVPGGLAQLWNGLVRRVRGEREDPGADESETPAALGPELDELLEGPNAFAFGMTDPAAPAKVVYDFINKTKNDGRMTVKGGLMGTEVLDVNKVKALSELPSKEVLLSRLVGSIQAPVAKLVYFLEALRKQQAGEE